MFKLLRRVPSLGRASGLFSKPVRRTFHTAQTLYSKPIPRLGAAALGVAGISLGLLYVATPARAESVEEQQTTEVEDDTTTNPLEATKKKYKYVIIGAGTAGHSALVAILQNDPDAKVLVLSAEHNVPYLRPPLTKDLWNSEDPNVAVNLKYKNWEGAESTVWLEGVDYKNDPRVTFTTLKAIDLDPYGKMVLLEDETIAEYDKCLIATGGDPRLLPFDTSDRVSTFRTLDDFRQVDQVARNAKHVVIVGGGFLGSELAWSITKKGVKVTQVFPEKGVLATVFPDYLSEYTTELGRKAGIDIHTEQFVQGITQTESGGVSVTLQNGVSIDADHVVVAAGIIPSTQLAESAELEVDSSNGGIVVNPELQIRSDLYAAGDVVSYYDATIGVRRRIEHHDHAVNSGKLAGENMTGARRPYSYLPFFWSDVGPVGFEAVGVVDSRLDKVAVWQKPEEEASTLGSAPEYKRGIVYYLKNGRVVGVLLLGVYGKVDDARTVIRRRQKIGDKYETLQRAISLEEQHH